MALWRRRPPRGKHALGAPLRVTPPAAPPAYLPPPLRPNTGATPPRAASDATPAGPRVELTFRDGSTAALDPTAARALDEIAQLLTLRDEVKH